MSGVLYGASTNIYLEAKRHSTGDVVNIIPAVFTFPRKEMAVMVVL